MIKRSGILHQNKQPCEPKIINSAFSLKKHSEIFV